MPTTDIPSPEENSIGLDLGGLSFTMPKVGEREITATVLFSFQSLLAVMESRAKIAKAKIAKAKNTGLVVSFVGANSIAGYVVSVAVSELFDMALADMFDAIGDVDLKTANRALSDAQGDPTKIGKHRYHMMAEKSLRAAYEKFQSAIDAREAKKWANQKLGYGNTQIRAEHGKAVIAASSIASILKMERLQPGVNTWANHAREHFDAFEAMIAKEYKEHADNYDRYESTYNSTRLTTGKRVADLATMGLGYLVMKRPLPPRNQLVASLAEGQFQRATEAVAVMNNLHQAKQRFETLYKQLKTD